MTRPSGTFSPLPPSPPDPSLPRHTPCRPEPRPTSPGPVTASVAMVVGMQDRLAERLLDQRVIALAGELDDDVVNRTVAALALLDASGDEPVHLWLSGVGADLDTPLPLIDALDLVGAPVHATALGTSPDRPWRCSRSPTAASSGRTRRCACSPRRRRGTTGWPTRPPRAERHARRGGCFSRRPGHRRIVSAGRPSSGDRTSGGPTMRIRSLTATTTIAATTLLLTACGSSPLDGKSGPEVADAAADALEEAGAVHMAGTVDQDGEESEVDLHLQGEDAIGSLSMGGLEIELLSVDGAVYLKGGADFWSSFGMPAEATSMFEDKWVTVPEEEAAGFQEFSFAAIVDQFRNPESEIQEEVSSGEVDGTDVVVVEQEDGSTLSVADDDPSYPLELTGADDAGTLTFSRFGEEEDITAPEDAIDLSEMMGGS